MTKRKHFLFELGVEELPAKNLQNYAIDLMNGFAEQLHKANLAHSEINYFVTPRRLAIMIADLIERQEDHEVVRSGPNIKAAYDSDGKPTKAALGFANSCDTTIDNLITITDKKGREFLAYRYQVVGKTVFELMPEICQAALKKITIPKPMRWGDTDYEFMRPVHWLVLLYGDETIKCQIMGLTSGRQTHGHRYHHPGALKLGNAKEYAQLLYDTGFVVADYTKRQQIITAGIAAKAKELNAEVLIDEALLDEVTGLVEWPVILCAQFNEAFLKVPPEALISAMKTHQKSFPVVDDSGKLLPYFITVANIASKNQQQVIHGNERVMSARLADAAFFYHTDCKQSLASRLEQLKHIVFQAKLGTLYDKTQRIANLASSIAEKIADSNLAHRAGLLCKADLVTDMVAEFPELQGTIGYYYAINDGEQEAVAIAISDHYRPRYSGDDLPRNAIGDCVALADKLDTLIGIFGINQLPTGDKDPFATRRAALGMLRIIIEHEYELNLNELLKLALTGYNQTLANKDVIQQVQSFIVDRLPALYQEHAISTDTLNAVLTAKTGIDNPLDIHRRIMAVNEFRKLPEAKSLALANKRASNILTKNGIDIDLSTQPFSLIKPELFEQEAEYALFNQIKKLQDQSIHFNNKMQAINYPELLKALASLQQPVDKFFDDVLVNAEDQDIRHNRFALLAALRELFLLVADISKLQE